MSEIEIVENAERGMFEIRVDGELAGTSEYVRRGTLRAQTHTIVDKAFGGQGLAGKLTEAALQAAKRDGDQVLPFCTYVSHYISRHPEHLELVPAELRPEFDL